jgi:hypothetical protein
VDELIRSKSHPQEIRILLCSRIDALASGSTSEGESSGNAFTSFVTMFGGSRNYSRVSALEICITNWITICGSCPGMLEKAGRVQIFSRVNEPILKLLVDSEIALTLEGARRLLKRIQLALRRTFRVAPGQSRKKHPLASAAARRYRSDAAHLTNRGSGSANSVVDRASEMQKAHLSRGVSLFGRELRTSSGSLNSKLPL